MKTLPRLVLAGIAAPAALFSAALAAEVKLTRAEDRVRVEIDGQLFTEYIFKGGPKPYLHPIIGADGTPLSRDYPMKNDTPGEERDHPHHRSLWFTHGAVNGVDFWTECATKGTIVNESITTALVGGAGEIRARNRWVTPEGKVSLTDETVVRIRAEPEGRLLDYEVTLMAPAGEQVVFGDTKEGSMAIRLPAWMTPPHTFQKAKTEGKGRIVNDAGIENVEAWGKKSTWVDYHAPKDGKVYGVAIFDHPTNPRHPTWWHVRDYGLFAANPFGQRDFEAAAKHEAGKGNLTIPAGGKTTFRWRFYFHMGDEKAGKVAEKFKDYAAGK